MRRREHPGGEALLSRPGDMRTKSITSVCFVHGGMRVERYGGPG
jgi:hypothetical protein